MSSRFAFPPLRWPAVLHYDGQPELAFIGSLQAWQAAADLQHHVYHAKDRLIDADGAVYQLTERMQNQLLPQATGQHIGLDEMLTLVRAHLAREGRSCIAKLYAPSIADAMAMADDDGEDAR
ncbi:MAG TPA: DUF4144 family protein [Methylovorus sp.]|jgi:site-specific recombinase|nr:DUF4144 family protein [Methylovorus sp.]